MTNQPHIRISFENVNMAHSLMQYPILENKQVAVLYFKLTLDISQSGNLPIPGQFYNLRCSETNAPLLRRPFSMHRIKKARGATALEILYRVIGNGTEWLSRRRRGESVNAIGPLGNGFIIEKDITDVLLIARGIGIAPLYAIGEVLGMRNHKTSVHILMGARKKERLFYKRELHRIGTVHFYTDDGSEGFHGRAPDLLISLIKAKRLSERFSLYACGPPTMLLKLADISAEFGVPGQVALEDHMGCGFGACLSCACPLMPEHINRNKHWQKPALQWSEDRRQVYSLICKDGPVYDIQEVNWNEWVV